MKIGYIGGFWATNIGNSFYDLGAISLLENIYGKENVYFIPDIANWFWKVSNNYEPLFDIKLDICLFAGPIFNQGIFNYNTIFDNLLEKDIKIGFISSGASLYTLEEKNNVCNFLKKYKKNISFISTRDNETYNLYKDFGVNCYNGLCTSMFLNNAVNIPALEKNYIVYNFHYFKEPFINLINNNAKVSKRSSLLSFQDTLNGMDIIRTNHETFTRFKWLLFNRPNMYYCDIPYGYLTIYKNSRYVFSDRVHTCAATLILGGTAMYIKGSKRSNDGRNNLFKKIGVEDIYNEPVKLNFEYINKEKSKMIEFINSNLGN
jgi:hypothetical protein